VRVLGVSRIAVIEMSSICLITVGSSILPMPSPYRPELLSGRCFASEGHFTKKQTFKWRFLFATYVWCWPKAAYQIVVFLTF
jgi:hypothetical protein